MLSHFYYWPLLHTIRHKFNPSTLFLLQHHGIYSSRTQYNQHATGLSQYTIYTKSTNTKKSLLTTRNSSATRFSWWGTFLQQRRQLKAKQHKEGEEETAIHCYCKSGQKLGHWIRQEPTFRRIFIFRSQRRNAKKTVKMSLEFWHPPRRVYYYMNEFVEFCSLFYTHFCCQKAKKNMQSSIRMSTNAFLDIHYYNINILISLG